LFQLTESELVSVFVAQKALEAYRGTPFEQPLRTAFQKLQAATNNPAARVSISWEDLGSAISFRHFAAHLPDMTIFAELAKAIQIETVVEFDYKKLDAKAFEKRTVEPWHLACVSGQWYLPGYKKRKRDRSNLEESERGTGQISKVDMTEDPFRSVDCQPGAELFCGRGLLEDNYHRAGQAQRQTMYSRHADHSAGRF
jgi:hypothetical protein